MNTKSMIIVGAFGVLGVLAESALAQTAIVRVDGDNGSANPPGQGTGWGSNAYKYLQDALAEAEDLVDLGYDVQLWVAATAANNPYLPDTSGLQDPRTATFAMVTHVSLFGGFAGNEALLSERDIFTNETILSGDIGTPNDNDDNCYHVVKGQQVGDARLDGFTITAGNANGNSGSDNIGAGIVMYGSSLSIINCRITENEAGCYGSNSGQGAGMYITSESSPPPNHSSFALVNCEFSKNKVVLDGEGGALFLVVRIPRKIRSSSRHLPA